jgi:toxin YoeB
MEIEIFEEAQDDLDYWKKSGKVSILKKIKSLLESIQETPFEGVGKPEGLKNNLSGLWSRRIDRGNRLIYKVTSDVIYILSCRGHYD